MSLSRRNAFIRLAAAVSAGAVAFRASTAAADESAASLSAGAAPAGVPKVVYHLADLDKVDFVMGNIGNHFKGMGGTDKVHIELVVHGPALLAFKVGRANPDLTRRLAQIQGQGVGLNACGNTLDAQKLTTADLLPGFSRVNEGGVVRLATLQAQGYAYLRP
jgi:intracellular sulfur oxidation DsrE/DsrF family protein